ncbi:MAG: thiolase family protein [Paracoccus sp. (in: a-proteobacteria)]|uniref:thiolase family protein n=1 Tax=Paracoccus sp. TaxID=267 RepID=UPI0039E534AF
MSVILAARRTAVLPRNGGFAALDLHELAAPVITALLADAGLAPGDVDEIVVGNALGAGGNPARRVALAAGLPLTVAGLGLDRQCCSGLDAILLADALIRAGRHRIVLAGGVESYSRRPLRLRTFADGRPPQPYEQAPFTPWPKRDPDMAQAAAALAARLRIDRARMDRWAVESHAKALAARDRLAPEIVPVRGIVQDGFPRAMTAALCARAKALAGPITAANTAVAADGAAFCLVAAPGILPKGLARILSGATLGDDPELPGLAPVPAIRAALEQAGLRARDLAVAEIMEAFAVQAIACQDLAGIDPRIVNPGGGGLARGHPIGASGAINAVRLVHELRPGQAGLATIAAAGGIGTALVLERL